MQSHSRMLHTIGIAGSQMSLKQVLSTDVQGHAFHVGSNVKLLNLRLTTAKVDGKVIVKVSTNNTVVPASSQVNSTADMSDYTTMLGVGVNCIEINVDCFGYKSERYFVFITKVE